MTSEQINAINIAIANILKPLSVLSAENKVYHAGRFIGAVDDSGNIGLKMGTWDWENVDISEGTAFNDLPWIVSPEQAGSGRLNVFSVKNTDPSYDTVAADDDNPTGLVVITDSRLLGKADYPVMCTQFGGGAFRDDQLEYDAPGGKVSIKIDSLADGETIWITLPMGMTADPDYSALTAQIDELRAMLAPIVPTGGGAGKAKMWWTGTLEAIPDGWQECEEMRGLYPIHIKTTDPDFNYTPGAPAGSKTIKITSTDQLPKFRLFTVVNDGITSAGLPGSIGRAVSSIRSIILSYLKSSSGGPESYSLCGSAANNQEPTISPTSWVGKDIPDGILNIPNSIAGYWIEYVGITA